MVGGFDIKMIVKSGAIELGWIGCADQLVDLKIGTQDYDFLGFNHSCCARIFKDNI